MEIIARIKTKFKNMFSSINNFYAETFSFFLIILILLLPVIMLIVTNPERKSLIYLLLILYFLIILWVILFVIVVLVRCGVFIIKGYRRSNMLYDGEQKEYFKNLDECLKSWRETNEQYKLCIYYINRVYKDINFLITEKDLKELYRRKDFIEKGLSAPINAIAKAKHLLFIMVGFALTAVSAKIDFEGFETFLGVGIVSFGAILIFMTLVILVSHARDGRFGSYRHEVLKFELEKINEYITCIYESIEDSLNCEKTDMKMQILRTQRVVASIVLNKAKMNKIKKWEEINGLELVSDKDIPCCELIEVKIDDKYLVFALDKSKLERFREEKVNNPEKSISIRKLLISKAYETLYDKLKGYYKETPVVVEEGLEF